MTLAAVWRADVDAVAGRGRASVAPAVLPAKQPAHRHVRQSDAAATRRFELENTGGYALPRRGSTWLEKVQCRTAEDTWQLPRVLFCHLSGFQALSEQARPAASRVAHTSHARSRACHCDLLGAPRFRACAANAATRTGAPAYGTRERVACPAARVSAMADDAHGETASLGRESGGSVNGNRVRYNPDGAPPPQHARMRRRRRRHASPVVSAQRSTPPARSSNALRSSSSALLLPHRRRVWPAHTASPPQMCACMT